MKLVHTNLLKKLPADRRVLATVGIFHQICLFTNNTISHNVLVGIHLEFTKVDFHGDSFIIGNNIVGGFGGGIRIYQIYGMTALLVLLTAIVQIMEVAYTLIIYFFSAQRHASLILGHRYLQ